MTDVSRADNYRGVFDTRLGFGEKPAVIVIDFVKAYTTEGAPFFAQGVVEAMQKLKKHYKYTSMTTTTRKILMMTMTTKKMTRKKKIINVN